MSYLLFYVFFCAHLGGETGLLKQFKDAGFRLNPLQALD
jgi:hypothetical protein|tara:strand:- start:977 stop:1093 length:117 start_codon:yes stop_codon:yes gene_type:complete